MLICVARHGDRGQAGGGHTENQGQEKTMCAEHGERHGGPLGTRRSKLSVCVLYRRFRRGRPTSIVLLLLVIVAELSLALCCHPSLRLHHLFGLVRAPRWLVPLVCVEVLEVRAGEGARIPKVAAGRVVPGWSASAHTGICLSLILSPWGQWHAMPTKLLGEVSLGAAHGHGFASAGAAKHLSALDEVVEGPVDLWRNTQSSAIGRDLGMGIWGRDHVGVAMRPGRRPIDGPHACRHLDITPAHKNQILCAPRSQHHAPSTITGRGVSCIFTYLLTGS